MSIISTIYTRAGDYEGMPLVQESGQCTNDTGTLNQLRAYENESIQIARVARRSGLTVKNLAGSSAPRTRTVADEHLGRFENCIQIGRTETQLFAPRQPLGPFAGKCILTYRRQWLCLGNGSSTSASPAPGGS